MTTPRGTNPDTGLLLASPSVEQQRLVAELCSRLGRADDPADTIRQALTEAVVRQHGRTLRACRADLDEYAQVRLDNARYALAEVPAAPATISPERLLHAAQSAAESAALRTAPLRATRA